MRAKDPLSKIGQDPDPRFSFANERTFLAWIRTALALIVGGLAVIHLLPPLAAPGGRRILGIPLIVIGTLIALTSYGRWERNERALRTGTRLPASRLPVVLAYAVAVIALAAAVVSLLP